jgi:hypothetical protein
MKDLEEKLDEEDKIYKSIFIIIWKKKTNFKDLFCFFPFWLLIFINWVSKIDENCFAWIRFKSNKKSKSDETKIKC